MGYFSNGTEGMAFQERYCFHCRNWRDLEDGRGEGCPIWDAHLLYSYELCNSETPGKVILDMLIPRTLIKASDGLPVPDNECAMFLPRADGFVPGQMTLELEDA